MPPIPFAFSPLLLPRLDRGKGARVPVRRRRHAPAPAAIVPAAPRSTLSAHAPVLLALFVLEPRLGILDLRVKLGASFQVHTSIRQKSGPGIYRPENRMKIMTGSVWCGQAAMKQRCAALRYASAADCRQAVGSGFQARSRLDL